MNNDERQTKENPIKSSNSYKKVFSKEIQLFTPNGIPYPINLNPHEKVVCPLCGNVMPKQEVRCVGCGDVSS